MSRAEAGATGENSVCFSIFNFVRKALLVDLSEAVCFSFSAVHVENSL